MRHPLEAGQFPAKHGSTFPVDPDGYQRGATARGSGTGRRDPWQASSSVPTPLACGKVGRAIPAAFTPRTLGFGGAERLPKCVVF